jgi:hypothetical protein
MAKSKQAQKSSSSKPASSQSAQAKKPVTKTRGTVLTVMLVLIIIHSIIASYLVYTNMTPSLKTNTTALGVLVLTNIACIVAAVAMWFWKEWGIYVYLGAAFVQMAVHMMMTGSVIMIPIYDLLPVAIVMYVINLQHKRQLFA